MTPLAQRLTRLMLDGKVQADHEFAATVTAALNGAHLFEVTGALPITTEIFGTINKSSGGFAPCTFLPAPKTWIEWRTEAGDRYAIALSEDGARADVTKFRATAKTVEAGDIGVLDLQTGEGYRSQQYLENNPEKSEWANRGIWLARIFLAIINSPRIVGRRTHAPHKGLARELRQLPGIGPLHDWHEIKLEIAKPREIDDGEPHTDTLTGRRALHFCRKHIRIRLGKLEYVRAHWRGDPSVGIRRGTYVVA